MGSGSGTTAGHEDVIGKTVKIEGVPFTVVGVTRNGFKGITADLPPEVTIPITAMPLVFGISDIQKDLWRPDSLRLEAAGRLKPGYTLERARAQLESLWPVNPPIDCAHGPDAAGTQPFLFAPTQSGIG